MQDAKGEICKNNNKYLTLIQLQQNRECKREQSYNIKYR